MSSSFGGLLVQSATGQGWIGTWSPGIGDPNLAGWVTVVAYLIAASLCLKVYLRQRRMKGTRAATPVASVAIGVFALFLTRRRIARLPLGTRVSALWLGFATMLFFLGINKQLDLQTALTELGRIAAFSGGWYDVRQKVQLAFICVVVVAAAWVFRTVLALAAGNVRQMAFVLVGNVFLLGFVAIRASSFHHVDRLLGLNLGGLKMNWILELGGIGLVIRGAWAAARVHQPARRAEA